MDKQGPKVIASEPGKPPLFTGWGPFSGVERPPVPAPVIKMEIQGMALHMQRVIDQYADDFKTVVDGAVVEALKSVDVSGMVRDTARQAVHKAVIDAVQNAVRGIIWDDDLRRELAAAAKRVLLKSLRKNAKDGL